MDSTWRTLFRSRLWSSAAFEVPLAAAEELGARIVRTLSSVPVRNTLAELTRGPIRYRLAFKHGHRRALVWRLADELRTCEYVNDPTNTTWEIFVDDERNMLEITPRRAADPRFAWRVAEVPAASHPTIAAALAFVAGVKRDDRVWDPFVGSAAELIERERLGAVAKLIGTDVDEGALAAARANLDAANVTAELVHGDARTHDVGPVDLIITNPPLGSRVKLDAKTLLVEALPRFAAQLAPGGRLVWITPATKRTSPVAEQCGLRRSRRIPVDLGGVRGTLERWDR